jgi:hypothetical protein
MTTERGSNSGDPMARTETLSQIGMFPDRRGVEPLDSRVASLGFAHLPRDAAQLAALYRQPSAIEHLGNVHPKFTGHEVQEVIGGPSWHTVVARNAEGRILASVSIEAHQRSHSARLQLLVAHQQVEGMGIASAVTDVSLAYVFGPEEEGGLDRTVIESGVFVGIGEENLPRSLAMLYHKGFGSQGTMPDFADSWDPVVVHDFVPRRLVRITLQREAYLGMAIQHPEPKQENLDKMHKNLAILYGKRPPPHLPKEIPAA